MQQTAGAVIIGDEILSGKIRDENTVALIEMLARTNVVLQRVALIRDDLDEIADTVKCFANTYDHVFTSGGMGPTHDDLTIEGIARAFSRPVVHHPELVTLLKAHLGARANEVALRMACVPAGAEIVGGGPFPLLRFRNIFILPGVPPIFAAKLASIEGRFAKTRTALVRLYIDNHESEITDPIDATVAAHPTVKIGSYPAVSKTDYRVMLTVEGQDPDEVASASDALEQALKRWMVRKEKER